ncbi:hypothetical protein D3C85_1679290 [compost metagenome]
MDTATVGVTQGENKSAWYSAEPPSFRFISSASPSPSEMTGSTLPAQKSTVTLSAL